RHPPSDRGGNGGVPPPLPGARGVAAADPHLAAPDPARRGARGRRGTGRALRRVAGREGRPPAVRQRRPGHDPDGAAARILPHLAEPTRSDGHRFTFHPGRFPGGDRPGGRGFPHATELREIVSCPPERTTTEVHMQYTTILFEVKDHVARITLNRPEAANALNLDMSKDLMHAALRCSEDPDVRAVIVTGAGRMFSGGGDLKSFAAQGEHMPYHLKEVTTYLHAAVSRFTRMDAPVIAAVNGT